MKKFLPSIASAILLLSVIPTPAHAELQCFTPPYSGSSLNVQNARQCASENSAARLFDTSANTWSDPGTGAQVYDPSYTCVGLAPAYRTNTPSVGGDCLPGYKLGQVTNDQNGNLVQVNYADGSVETAKRDAVGSVQNTTYSQTPATPAGPATGGKLVYIPLEPLPGGNTSSYNSLSVYLNLVFKILISIGAMVAIITLVLGGITYMVSEIVDKKSEAKRRIQAALLGLLLLLTCWLILYEINPKLTQFSLAGIDQPGARTPSATGETPSGFAADKGPATNTEQTNAFVKDCEGGGRGVVKPDPNTNTPTCYPNL